MIPKPDGADQLLAAIDDEPRGRSELLDSSGVPFDDWRPAIQYLLGTGEVRQLGTRRGARYIVASSRSIDGPSELVRETPRRYERPEQGPKGAYHDVIEEVLRELTGREPTSAGDASEAQLTEALRPTTTTFETQELVTAGAKWSVDEVRSALISFRENTLEPDLKPQGRSVGLLRKAMIDALLREHPRNRREFMLWVPERLLLGTDQKEIEDHLAAVLEILQRLDPEK